MMHEPWSIWIDTGGTFTDCLAKSPEGTLHRAKVLSSGAMRGRIVERLDSGHLHVEVNWEACDDFIKGFTVRTLGADESKAIVSGFDAAQSIIKLESPLAPGEPCAFEVVGDEPAPILAARLVTQTPSGVDLPPLNLRLGTTRGTNALLERKGARIALFITKGFGDLLRIGDQQRPDLFALEIIKPEPLYEQVVEVPGRLDKDGLEIEPLDLKLVEREAKRHIAQGIRVASVALMHAYCNPSHEEQVIECLKQAGMTHVVGSAELSPLIKFLHRTETCVVEAYLGPIIESYLQDVARQLEGHSEQDAEKANLLHVMTSAGGLVKASSFRAIDSLLSGPAGGVAGAAASGINSGTNHIIGFDMGGTSTDVSRFDGDYEYRFEQTIANVRLVAPALAIETVAAGGGSICGFKDDRMFVGPHSASADPGPACYGAGGPLTLTDINLLAGRLNPERFEIPIEIGAAQHALEDVCAKIKDATGSDADPDELIDGFLEIANERMADAIEQISLRRGYDPSEYALVGFGGAGGQHAGAIAQRLGIRKVILPADASLLSAVGIGQAPIERFEQRQVLQLLDDIEDDLPARLNAMAEKAIDAVASEGIDRKDIVVRRTLVNLRLSGQDTSLSIDAPKDFKSL
ncbi:MAG: hydantoinase/oxoprolinase family protein, partial [Planctomycetota bacterium]|nr:hydantoinase/oxoprolinase family protein [Planctomycetota bacterium]